MEASTHRSDSERPRSRVYLSVDTVDNLELNTVGIREEPTESPAKNIPTQTGGGGDGGDGGGGGSTVEFTSLSAEVTDTNAQAIRAVTFTFDLSETGEDTDFTLADSKGNTNTETVTSSSGEQTIEVSIGNINWN